MPQRQIKTTNTGSDTHKGYNEKNPAQPQGAFDAESNQKGDLEARPKTSVSKLQKRKANLSNKK